MVWVRRVLGGEPGRQCRPVSQSPRQRRCASPSRGSAVTPGLTSRRATVREVSECPGVGDRGQAVFEGSPWSSCRAGRMPDLVGGGEVWVASCSLPRARHVAAAPSWPSASRQRIGPARLGDQLLVRRRALSWVQASCAEPRRRAHSTVRQRCFPLGEGAACSARRSASALPADEGDLRTARRAPRRPSRACCRAPAGAVDVSSGASASPRAQATRRGRNGRRSWTAASCVPGDARTFE